MPEPALKPVSSGGRLTKAAWLRINRRLDELHDRIDRLVPARTRAPEPPLRSPVGPLRLDSAYLGALLRRIENAWAEISAAGFGTETAAPFEPPLVTDPPRGTLRLSTLNRIIRRIEYLWSLQIFTSGSEPYPE